jgi:hypothetical protein
LKTKASQAMRAEDKDQFAQACTKMKELEGKKKELMTALSSYFTGGKGERSEEHKKHAQKNHESEPVAKNSESTVSQVSSEDEMKKWLSEGK